MKLWQFVLLLILLAAGGVIVAQEVRYRGQLEEARQRVRTVELMQMALDTAVAQAAELNVELGRERIAHGRTQEQAAAAIVELEEDLAGQRQRTRALEGDLRSRVAPENVPAVDSLVESHAQELEGERAVTEQVRTQLTAERRLRVTVDSTLFATQRALEDCLCTLDSAQVALDAFVDVTDGRGWASRAWDTVTSPRGLLTIAVVGLAAYGTWQLVDGGTEVNVYQDEKPHPLFSVDFGWPGSPYW